jgi:Fibronectin type III domain/Putative binding domain, N-terminal
LSWTNNSSFVSGFKIERSNGGGFSQITTVGAHVNTYTDPGLTPSTTYSYRVRAFNNGGDSGYSNESSAATFPLPCSYSISPTQLSNVDGGGGLVVRVNVTTSPGCSWSAVSNASWLKIVSVGSDYVYVDIGPNPGGPRSGTVTIAGRTFTVSQKSCLTPAGCL